MDMILVWKLKSEKGLQIQDRHIARTLAMLVPKFSLQFPKVTFRLNREAHWTPNFSPMKHGHCSKWSLESGT
jgi:hypothetical protein